MLRVLWFEMMALKRRFFLLVKKSILNAGKSSVRLVLRQKIGVLGIWLTYESTSVLAMKKYAGSSMPESINTKFDPLKSEILKVFPGYPIGFTL